MPMFVYQDDNERPFMECDQCGKREPMALEQDYDEGWGSEDYYWIAEGWSVETHKEAGKPDIAFCSRLCMEEYNKGHGTMYKWWGHKTGG